MNSIEVEMSYLKMLLNSTYGISSRPEHNREYERMGYLHGKFFKITSRKNKISSIYGYNVNN